MSILDTGTTIRNARLKSGFTLEKLSDGICTIQALNRIEKGKSGVSPSTFHALMERMGISCHVLPVFENWTDYECFTYVNEAKFYVNSWQLEKAYDSLSKEAKLNWNNNLINYQEWLLTYCKLIVRTYNYDHQKLRSIIKHAISLTNKNFDYSNINNLFLSLTEIELLLLYSYESIFLNDTEICLSIYEQLDNYLSHTNLTEKVKISLSSANALCYGFYLFFTKCDYSLAQSILEKYQNILIQFGHTVLIFEFSFLSALCYYYLGDEKKAIKLLWGVLFSSDSIDCTFTTHCLQFIHDKQIPIDDYYDLSMLRLKNKNSFDYPDIIDHSSFSNGIFVIDEYSNLTFGRLIQELRTRQGLSQNTVCNGLCSKSKLSKIENGTLTPDIILAESLLQRLGISERHFSFYGSGTENALHNLKYKTMFTSHIGKEEYQQYIDDFAELLDEKTVIYNQLYVLSTYFKLDITPLEKINILWDALSHTIPDFDIYHFYQYRFTWVELSILNNIAVLYRNTETPEKGIQLFDKIFEYREINHLSPLFEFTIYPATYNFISRYLYAKQYHDRLININEQHDLSLLYSSIPLFGSFAFHLCQSYYDSSKAEKGLYYINVTCAINTILKTETSTYELIDEIEQKHHVDLSWLHSS